jgi:VWFA-related protein
MIRAGSVRMTAGLFAALLSASSFGQAPSQPPNQAAGHPSSGAPAQAQPQAKQEPPVVRVTTRLVQVNVIVQDKKGEPVTDLTRDDFTLFDQGQAQIIGTFSVESLRTLPVAQPAPPNVFSNRFEQKTHTPTSVTVILLDGLNTRFEDMAYARAQIIKFLGQLQPQDRVALYTLTTRLTVLHDFTSDATSLLRALERSKGHVSTELAASEPEPANPMGIDALDEFLTAANQRMADFYTMNRVGRTAGTIEDIANHLARLPGRKNLVWVSGSFPFSIGLDTPFTPETASQERRTFSEEIERAARALNNANMAIYPVDARGLTVRSFTTRAQTFRLGQLGPPGQRRNPLGPIGLSPDRANIDTMNILADRTGGRAFYNTNDIQGSVRRAIEDSRVTYVLGFYPTHGNWDAKFREIKVQVKRPGLHLRYRRGYLALPEATFDSRNREVLMRAAVDSPLDDTSLGLEARLHVVDVPGAMTLKIELLVYSRDLTLVAQGDRWAGAVDVLFVQRGTDGKELAVELKTLSLNLARETYAEVMKKGLGLTRNLPPAPGAAQLRVVVRDVGSGSIGSLTIPLTKLIPSSGG